MNEHDKAEVEVEAAEAALQAQEATMMSAMALGGGPSLGFGTFMGDELAVRDAVLKAQATEATPSDDEASKT